MNEMVPRSYFTENMEEWQTRGYDVIDFTRADVDLTKLPKFYNEKFNSTGRRIEKNYLLNYLIFNDLAYYEKKNGVFKFYTKIKAS